MNRLLASIFAVLAIAGSSYAQTTCSATPESATTQSAIAESVPASVCEGAVTVSPSSLLTGLVSYWKMEETSGTRVDQTANANNLTDNNTVTSNTGVQGTAAEFTAANSESLSRTNASLTGWPTANFHVAYWCRRAAAASEMNHIGKMDSATNQREWRVTTIAGQTRAYLVASSDGITEDVNTNTGIGSMPDDTYVFVEVRRSGTTIGVAVNGGAFVDGTLSAVFNGTAVFSVGSRNNTPATFLTGRVDEVGIWSRVLTAGERACLYAAGAGVTYPFTGICN